MSFESKNERGNFYPIIKKELLKNYQNHNCLQEQLIRNNLL